VLEARSRLALSEGQKEKKSEKDGMKMKAKVETIFAFLLLSAFLLFSLPQQTLADQQDYVYPVIETDCEQFNATAYRFHPGDTLNFTFTVQGPVYAWYAENCTSYANVTYPPGGYIRSHVMFCAFQFYDGRQYCLVRTGFGTGRDFSSWGTGVFEGEHTLKVVYLLNATEEDFVGFLEVNFLSERKLRLEEWEPPEYTPSHLPTSQMLISGVTGAAAAFVVSAVIWHKKNAKKEVKNSARAGLFSTKGRKRTEKIEG